jgi:thiol-disulfide isomerase/thioredoxin
MMVLRSSFQLLLLFCSISVTTYAQNNQLPLLNIGDPAPQLRVRDWLKGTPFQTFDKGHVYVVEFWATWCQPCIASMPHLSDLAGEYKDRVTILGIDIYEKETTSMEKVKAFVDSMGHRMDYHVAREDSNFMEALWINASGEKDKGIPRSFVVNAEGMLAWIGHPKDLSEILPKIVNNKWDIKEALSKRNMDRHLAKLDDSLRLELMKYDRDSFKPGSFDKPDSTLFLINKIITNEPKLKYAPFVADKTFSALLQTEPHKAYEYGKILLVTPTYEDPPYGSIIGSIDWYSKKLNLPLEIYELGAEAYQAKIDKYGEFGNMNIPNSYNKMADMYWRAKNKLKAVDAMQKAIETLKGEKNFSATEMAAFETRLQQYKKM